MKFILRPLSELCSRNIEQRHPKDNAEAEFSYIDIGSVNNRTKQIVSPRKLKGAKASVRARQLVQSNDVLVSTVRPNLNAVALVPPDLDGQICSTGFCVLRCGPELLPGYLFAFVQSRIFVDALKQFVQGALYPAVTDRQVFAQKIPWIEVCEQKSIASRFMAQFESLSVARAAAEDQINEAICLSRKIRSGVQAKMVDFERVRLSELLLQIETGKSIQTTELIARDDQLGVLKVSAVSWGEFRAKEAKAVESGYQPEEHHRVRKGDVLLSRANTVDLVGAVVRADQSYPNRLLSDKTLRLILDEERCEPDYIVQVLRLPEARSHIEGNATGTSDSMRNISQDTIRATPLALPDLTDQRRIAAKLGDLEREMAKLTSAIQNQSEELELIPQKLLAKVFEL